MPTGDAAVGVDYVYSIRRAGDGVKIGEVPLRGVSFSRALSGVGELTGSISCEDPKALPYYLDPENFREITVVRNGVAVWNGPITWAKASLAENIVNVRAREAHWWGWRRTVEYDADYNRDVFEIVGLIWAHVTGKTGGALYDFAITGGSAGVTRQWRLRGAERRFAGSIIDDLAGHPTSGFEYRLDVTGDADTVTSRTLHLAAPSFTTVVTGQVLEPGAGLYDITDEPDLERAGNRVHVVPGTGAPTSLDNTGSLGAGDPLIESVLARPDLTEAGAADLADEFRRLSQPAVRSYVATYIPRASLPYGWCNLGGTVALKCDIGYLAVDDSRRVQTITTRPGEKGEPEKVDLTLTLPLDRLGA